MLSEGKKIRIAPNRQVTTETIKITIHSFIPNFFESNAMDALKRHSDKIEIPKITQIKVIV